MYRESLRGRGGWRLFYVFSILRLYNRLSPLQQIYIMASIFNCLSLILIITLANSSKLSPDPAFSNMMLYFAPQNQGQLKAALFCTLKLVANKILFDYRTQVSNIQVTSQFLSRIIQPETKQIGEGDAIDIFITTADNQGKFFQQIIIEIMYGDQVQIPFDQAQYYQGLKGSTTNNIQTTYVGISYNNGVLESYDLANGGLLWGLVYKYLPYLQFSSSGINFKSIK